MRKLGKNETGSRSGLVQRRCNRMTCLRKTTHLQRRGSPVSAANGVDNLVKAFASGCQFYDVAKRSHADRDL
jgi:hypothetical protein